MSPREELEPMLQKGRRYVESTEALWLRSDFHSAVL